MAIEPGQGTGGIAGGGPEKKSGGSGLSNLSAAQRTTILIALMFAGALTWIYFKKSSIQRAQTEATIAATIAGYLNKIMK